MAVTYPLFVFEKHDQSMRQIEDASGLRVLEGIDIENGEYAFWDANGNGVSVAAFVSSFTNKVGDATYCPAVFPLRDAFALYAKTLGLSDFDVDGPPTEVWSRLQREIEGRPKKRSFLSKLFR